MNENRKEERNNYTALGQLNVAGELLDFISYDISVNGILVEVLPGILLSHAEDFENLLKENCTAEFFVKELMFTGEADIVRVSRQNDSIFLGLEFRNVIYNANRLWHRRHYYRKSKCVSGLMIIDDEQQVGFESIDISMNGAMISLADNFSAGTVDDDQEVNHASILARLKIGLVVKVLIKELNLKGIAEIVWINQAIPVRIGLRYLQIEDKVLNFD